MTKGSVTKTIFHRGWDVLGGLPFNNDATILLNEDQLDSIELHAENLNNHQALALRNAFAYGFSVIRGPPGTGKTRTIASIADIAQAGGLRMLIIAPVLLLLLLLLLLPLLLPLLLLPLLLLILLLILLQQQQQLFLIFLGKFCIKTNFGESG